MLVAMASPIRPLASSVAGTNAALPLPQASMMSRCRSLPGSCQFGFFTNSAVGVTLAFTTARVREGAIFAIASVLAVTTRSQPMTRSAPPVSRRAACRSSGRAATRTWDVTAPYFCARPDMSSTETPFASRCAAMPMIWPMVMTPVPPMPVTRMPFALSSKGS